MPDLHAWITRQVDEAEEYTRGHILNPVNALRRCEADRKILNRHRSDPTHRELFDLARAHGLTREIFARLDQPEPPPTPGLTPVAF